MSNEKQAVSNPDTVDDAIFGSPDSFFDALESDVNGAIQDNTSETVQATPQNAEPKGSDKVNTNVEVPDDVNTLKSKLDTAEKRYSGSSREAQTMKAQLDELKPFVPVLEAMKNDSGLVDYVRDYFVSGGKVPTNIKERLKLDENFEFDADEMVNDESSDSRKVMDAIVDKKVNSQINNVINAERQKAHTMGKQIKAKKEAVELMQELNMTPEDFGGFIEDA